MVVGIVGSEAAKFTPETEAEARRIIRKLLSPVGTLLSSGHCHIGGVDIYAEEEAIAMGRYDRTLIFPPKTHSWSTGYAPRNRQIARASDIVVCITLKDLPPSYDGMRFEGCYHCNNLRPPHVKSGGCWTVNEAMKRGKIGEWYIIEPGKETQLFPGNSR